MIDLCSHCRPQTDDPLIRPPVCVWPISWLLILKVLVIMAADQSGSGLITYHWLQAFRRQQEAIYQQLREQLGTTPPQYWLLTHDGRQALRNANRTGHYSPFGDRILTEQEEALRERSARDDDQESDRDFNDGDDDEEDDEDRAVERPWRAPPLTIGIECEMNVLNWMAAFEPLHTLYKKWHPFIHPDQFVPSYMQYLANVETGRTDGNFGHTSVCDCSLDLDLVDAPCWYHLRLLDHVTNNSDALFQRALDAGHTALDADSIASRNQQVEWMTAFGKMLVPTAYNAAALLNDLGFPAALNHWPVTRELGPELAAIMHIGSIMAYRWYLHPETEVPHRPKKDYSGWNLTSDVSVTDFSLKWWMRDPHRENVRYLPGVDYEANTRVHRIPRHMRSNPEQLPTVLYHNPGEDVDAYRIASSGIEMTSPILVLKNPIWKANLRQILRALGETYAISVNGACGLHAHFGQGLEKPLKIGMVTRVAIILLTCHRVLDQIHPWKRISNRYAKSRIFKENDYIDEFDRMGANAPRKSKSLYNVRSPMTHENWMNCMIHHIQTLHEEDNTLRPWMEELGINLKDHPGYDENGAEMTRGQHEWRYSSFNLQSWFEHQTIEFRSHRGSLDADEIIHWVALIKSIFVFASKFTRLHDLLQVVGSWATAFTNNEKGKADCMNVIDLMLLLGTEHATIYHYMHVGIFDRHDYSWFYRQQAAEKTRRGLSQKIVPTFAPDPCDPTRERYRFPYTRDDSNDDTPRRTEGSDVPRQVNPLGVSSDQPLTQEMMMQHRQWLEEYIWDSSQCFCRLIPTKLRLVRENMQEQSVIHLLDPDYVWDDQWRLYGVNAHRFDVINVYRYMSPWEAPDPPPTNPASQEPALSPEDTPPDVGFNPKLDPFTPARRKTLEQWRYYYHYFPRNVDDFDGGSLIDIGKRWQQPWSIISQEVRDEELALINPHNYRGPISVQDQTFPSPEAAYVPLALDERFRTQPENFADEDTDDEELPGKQCEDYKFFRQDGGFYQAGDTIATIRDRDKRRDQRAAVNEALQRERGTILDAIRDASIAAYQASLTGPDPDLPSFDNSSQSAGSAAPSHGRVTRSATAAIHRMNSRLAGIRASRRANGLVTRGMAAREAARQEDRISSRTRARERAMEMQRVEAARMLANFASGYTDQRRPPESRNRGNRIDDEDEMDVEEEEEEEEEEQEENEQQRRRGNTAARGSRGARRRR